MLARRRIRTRMYFGVAMLAGIVMLLVIASVQGIWKFRILTKNIRERSTELPLAAELSKSVSDLRVSYSRTQTSSYFPTNIGQHLDLEDSLSPWGTFRQDLQGVRVALSNYRDQLAISAEINHQISDISQESDKVDQIEQTLNLIEKYANRQYVIFQNDRMDYQLNDEINNLQLQTSDLPGILKQRMDLFAEQARTEYHALWTLTGIATILAAIIFVSLIVLFRKWIFIPLERLLAGARKVARGDYDYRISIKTEDEMAEVAQSLNDMTHNFQEIQRDLEKQVAERTREAIRKEQLASVGFLAAGVAHEINNPLTTIAVSAESMESRIEDILSDISERDPECAAEISAMKSFLHMIHEEAFRCKGITTGLLDFSRMGDAQKSPNNITDLVFSVVEMLKHMPKYRGRNLKVDCANDVIATINPQEIKQVILNVVTNAMDSVKIGGNVSIRLKQTESDVRLTVEDDGCGMSEYTLQHLFEPFYTQREDDQGTGLGLSITYRIVDEHKGTIRPYSDGPGKGSKFIVTLPKCFDEKQAGKRAA
jgi:two-component system, NtrC family, sensor kinase